MRGNEKRSESLFSYVRLEERIPADHPLRAIRTLVDAALAPLNERFEALYSPLGRPSIAPETLLQATLLQAFFSVRSERQLMEQIDYNLLFRWFVGLSLDEGVWHPTVFTHNRDRLLEANVARDFLASLLALPQVKRLLSSDMSPSTAVSARRASSAKPPSMAASRAIPAMASAWSAANAPRRSSAGSRPRPDAPGSRFGGAPRPKPSSASLSPLTISSEYPSCWPLPPEASQHSACRSYPGALKQAVVDTASPRHPRQKAKNR
jgi:transposase